MPDLLLSAPQRSSLALRLAGHPKSLPELLPQGCRKTGAHGHVTPWAHVVQGQMLRDGATAANDARWQRASSFGAQRGAAQPQVPGLLVPRQQLLLAELLRPAAQWPHSHHTSHDLSDDFGGGGVDAALHRVAGPELRRLCASLPEISPGVRCPTGEARITAGADLHVGHVIHAVAPVFPAHAPEEARKLLEQAFLSALRLAEQYAIQAVAIPALGCGLFGCPVELGARAAIEACRLFSQTEKGRPPEVHFVLYKTSELNAWLRAAREAVGASKPCAPSSQQVTDQRNLERLLNTLLQEDAEAHPTPRSARERPQTQRWEPCYAGRRPSQHVLPDGEPHTSANQLKYGSSEADTAAALELDALIKARDWKQVQKKIKGKVWKLSCSKAGSEQLQQLLVSGGHVKSGGAKDWNAAVETVISELRTHVMEAFFTKPNFSNYVLQACIQALSPERFKFILEELKDRVPQVAMDAQGCRVMQRIIEHVGDKNEHTLQLLQQILPRLREVAMNRYGNHVVQKFLEMASQSQRDLIAQELLRLVQDNREVLFEMANSKFASHVLEKAMANASAELQESFLCILETELHTRVDRRKLKKKKFGSFVWRSCLRVRAQWDSSPKASSSSSCPSPAPFTPNGFAYEGTVVRLCVMCVGGVVLIFKRTSTRNVLHVAFRL
ncbi:unnamed protein product [Symbiodinium sp. CCMP2592]|nr:unnamed protein product [Symbiodinium sp. CCMP2592]